MLCPCLGEEALSYRRQRMEAETVDKKILGQRKGHAKICPSHSSKLVAGIGGGCIPTYPST